MSVEFDKESYKKLKAHAKTMGIKTATRKLNGPGWASYNYNGVSLAYINGTKHGTARMIAVAASYCAPEDKFSKKVGKYNALKKLCMEGQFVQLPLAQFVRETTNTDDVAEVLLDIFTV